MKKIIAFLLVICAAVSLFCACGNDEDDAYNIKRITVDEAKAMLDDGGYILLDVRTLEEYEEKYIPGCMLVTIDKSDVEAFKTEIVNKIPNKDAKIIVYCKSGFRSDIAAKAMSTLGYKNLYEMSAGIDGWTYEVGTIEH